MWSLLCPILLLLAAPTIFADIICSDAIYGRPAYVDCLQALTSIPLSDHYARYFIENPLLTAPPHSNWQAFTDPRPSDVQTNSIQLPKLWGYGKIYVSI